MRTTFTSYELNEAKLGVNYGRKIGDKQVKITSFWSADPEEAGLRKGDFVKRVNGIELDWTIRATLTESQSNAVRNKKIGDYVGVIAQRGNTLKTIRTKLVSLTDRNPNASPPNPMYGGVIHPKVEKEGFLPFQYDDSEHVVRDNRTFRLILPLIGVEFDASDRALRSLELQFSFNRATGN